MLKNGFARLSDLWNQNDFDAVILHCELVPFMPGWVERALIRKPYIYDYDDAFYMKYISGRLRLTSPLLGTKFDTIMSGAAAVTAGNIILTKYAKQHNSNTRYFPTVVDTDRYIPNPVLRAGNVFTVGWIGSPSTAQYLSELVTPLSAIAQDGPVQFIVIGGKAPKIPNVTVIEHDWNENTELDLINSFDVGVMPLPDNDWSRGKCAFKLIQYMACSVPVIASAVGANFDLVHSDCGFLTKTPQDWIDAFKQLREHPDKRTSMGDAGRSRVVHYYSLNKNSPVLVDVISNVAGLLN
jgi:glycosyltransferase involved in cell wall biosynthesis